ncbi:TRAP transporter substrate-binding protein [Enterovirga sp. CN4-39]|uniref:TRAP transporter substrate-binding protein n=1 Tax=Enterovirga sp. CN4-39 TaxID=3400910 RepID=UPI003C034E99
MFRNTSPSRRQVLAGGAAAIGAGLIGAPALAQAPKALKFAHEAPQTAIKGQTAIKFAELVAQHGNGALKVDVFPGAQLVPTTEEIRAAVRGQVDVIAPFTSYFASLDPVWDIFYEPLMLPSADAAMTAFGGDLGQRVLKTLDTRGMNGMAIWFDGPVYIFTNTEALTGPDSLKGKKIRVFPCQPLESWLKKVGAIPVSMPATEVYLALQQGALDGVVSTPTYAAPARWYEVLKSQTRVLMGFGGYGVAIGKRSWDGLSAEQKSIVERAMKDATVWNHEQAKSNLAASEKILASNGMKLNDPQPDLLAAWAREAEKVYEEQNPQLRELISTFRKA